MCLLALGVANLFAVSPPATAATPDTTVTVDGNGTGRTFDGIGAVSGGGGNSRLLIDYPEPQRSQILDYMFKPGYGAALQVLKVEIGGDTNSTDGAEASHEHVQGQVRCDTGYEWWLMEQAKARNPDIKLAALAWGAPGWVGSNGNIWNANGITYLKDWLGCARQNGLSIDYLGGRNESGTPAPTWFPQLRSALNTAGYGSVKLVADDDWHGFPVKSDTTGTWPLLTQMGAYPDFANSVDIIGHHYPCEGTNGGTGDTGTAYNCPVPAAATQSGKPIWASENGSLDMNAGTAQQIRTITRGYLDGKITATFNWPLIAALYPNLPFNTVGLLQADQPWSGYYNVGATVWSTAQITQVTKPGWKFIDSASGYLDGGTGSATSPGSYVTLKSPTGGDWTTVVETSTATGPRTVHLNVTGGLSTGTVHVWASNLASTDPSQYFLRGTDITPQNGSYSFTAQPGYVYSLTTTTGQSKGSTALPPQASLTLPYNDNFDGYALHSEAALLADMNGSFEVASCGGGRSGQCVRQMANQTPLPWAGNSSQPYTLMGDGGWRDYTIGVDTLLEQPGTVRVMARVGAQWGVAKINAYSLQVSDQGAWSIVKTDTNGTTTNLRSGTTTALGTGTWHHLAVTVQGSTITAAVDNVTVGSATDAAFTAGQVGLALGGYQTQEFDNLTINPIGQLPSAYTYQITSHGTKMALDLAGDPTVTGAKTVQQPVSSTADSQKWQLSARNGSFTLTDVASGEVLDVPGNSTTDGLPLEQWTANGGDNQHWRITPTANGSYTIATRLSSGYLLDVFRALPDPGTSIVQYHSTGQPNQQWDFTPVPAAGAGYNLSNVASGLVMDMSGGSLNPGGSAIQWTPNGGTNQVWDLHTAATAGMFTITNRMSGLCLDVAGSSTADQAQIQQQTCAVGSRSQQWAFQPAANGHWALINLNSTKALDTAGSSTARGANIVQQTPSSTAVTQQWTLIPS
ncbi:RICIN domain-containing protein [Streptomyces sp. NRRL B-24484]|uniref:RICIN domain-containing protein n=1 Tax=Streptomyces sp. NRRL B-24484 TaxID=1463833 RepID=UPI0006941C39|nr:RICIN domain-containing protein [Streptomyces sp. NRRL B-24484]